MPCLAPVTRHLIYKYHTAQLPQGITMSNITIPNLVSAGPLNGSDLVLINQGGLTKKITASAFLNETIVNINTNSSNFVEIVSGISASFSSDINAQVTTIYEAIASNSFVLAQQITNVSVNAGSSLAASVISLNQAIISNSTVLANQINALSVTVNGQITALEGVFNHAIVSNNSALFNQVVGISASLNNKIDFQVGQISNVIINDSSMLLSEINAINLNLQGNLQAAIGTFNQALITESASLFSQINGVRVTAHNELSAFAGTINSVIINDSSALASQITGVSASLSSNLSALSNTVFQALVSNSSALASQITTVSSQLSGSIAASASQALSAVVDASHALAQEIDTLTSNFNNVSGSISLIQSIAASDSSLLLQRIVDVSAGLSGALVNATNGLVVDIRGVSLDLIQSIDSISSNLNGVSGSVTSLLSSMNGIDNSWTLKLDSNGYVSGLTSVNNGTTASFNVIADNFSVAKAGSSSAVPAFSVNVATSPPTLNFLGKISAGSIVSGSVSTANLYIGSTTSPGPNYFALEGPNERLVVRDGNGTERVRLGYMDPATAPGTTTTAYGLAIWDSTGNLVVSAGGLGNNVVYGNNLYPATTARAYGDHVGDGTHSLSSTPYVLGNIVISIGTVGEGMLLATSGLFTSQNAVAPAAPVVVYVAPPQQTPVYEPPDRPEGHEGP